MGLPGLSGFVAEFAIFFATWQTWNYLLLIPIISVAITAAYYIWAMQRTIFGPLTDRIDTSHLRDVNWFEAAPLAMLCAIIILVGLYPEPNLWLHAAGGQWTCKPVKGDLRWSILLQFCLR